LCTAECRTVLKSLAFDLGLLWKTVCFKSLILVLQNSESLKSSDFTLEYGQRAKDSFPDTTQISGECGKENARTVCSIACEMLSLDILHDFFHQNFSLVKAWFSSILKN